MEESLSKAKEIAEDWFLQLRGKLRAGEIKTEKTFGEASRQFLREYDIITQASAAKAMCPCFRRSPSLLTLVTNNSASAFEAHRRNARQLRSCISSANHPQ